MVVCCAEGEKGRVRRSGVNVVCERQIRFASLWAVCVIEESAC